MRDEGGAALVLELILVALLFGALAVGAVRLVQARNHPSLSSTSGVSSSAHGASSNASSPHAASSNPYAGWHRYRSTQEPSLSFLYPPTWQATAIAAADPKGDGLQLISPNKSEVWWQSSISGLGGVCPPNATTTVTAIYPLGETPSLFVVATIEAGTTHYGVIGNPAPSVGANLPCPFYTTFPSKLDPAREMAFETNGTVTPLDEPAVVSILRSLTY